jgi:hypothetical protein
MEDECGPHSNHLPLAGGHSGDYRQQKMSTNTDSEHVVRGAEPREVSQRGKARRRRAGFIGLTIGLASGFTLATVLAAQTEQEPPLDLGTRWDEGWPIEVGTYGGHTFWAGTEDDGTRTCLMTMGEGPLEGVHTCGNTDEKDGTVKFGHTSMDPLTGLLTVVTHLVVLKNDGSFTFTVDLDVSAERNGA